MPVAKEHHPAQVLQAKALERVPVKVRPEGPAQVPGPVLVEPAQAQLALALAPQKRVVLVQPGELEPEQAVLEQVQLERVLGLAQGPEQVVEQVLEVLPPEQVQPVLEQAAQVQPVRELREAERPQEPLAVLQRVQVQLEQEERPVPGPRPVQQPEAR